MRLKISCPTLALAILALVAKSCAKPSAVKCDAASETPRMPPPSHYYCGTFGQLLNPSLLGSPVAASNLDACSTQCIQKHSCRSFGYNEGTGTCQLYSKALIAQAYVNRGNRRGHVIHYNRHCFACPPSCRVFKTHTVHTETTAIFTTTVSATTTSVTIQSTTTIYAAASKPVGKRSAQVTSTCPTAAPTTTITATSTVSTSTVYLSTVTEKSTAPLATQSVSVDCSVCPTFNVVNNPGFESGFLFPWDAFNSNDAGFDSGTGEGVSSDNPASGTYEFRTFGGGGANFNDFVLKQSVFVCPGYSYKLSFSAEGTDIYAGTASAYLISSINGAQTAGFPSARDLSDSYQAFSQTWGGLNANAAPQMIDILVKADGPSFEAVYLDDFNFSAVCSG